MCWRRESLVSRWCRSSCLRTFLTQRRALMIADNRIADNAGWDDEVLAAEPATLRDEVVDLAVSMRLTWIACSTARHMLGRADEVIE